MFGKLLAGLLLTGAIALVVSACDVDKLSRLRPGSSSADEVRQVMGKPT